MYLLPSLVFMLTILKSALASITVDEEKHQNEVAIGTKERVALQSEMKALHEELAKMRSQLEESQRKQARLQDEVDALRFSNDTLVQHHNEQRGAYNKKLQEVYAEKAAAQKEHEADEVKWSELLADTETTQKQMMDGTTLSALWPLLTLCLQRCLRQFRKFSDSRTKTTS
jgi:septal ring factor EnvC (AmiA/AmiB activator)